MCKEDSAEYTRPLPTAVEDVSALSRFKTAAAIDTKVRLSRGMIHVLVVRL